MIGVWLALTVGAAFIGFAAGRWRARRRPGPLPSPPPVPTNAGEQVIELSTLAGGLAHEIRNPLSTLKVNLQLLGEDWRDETVAVPELRRRSLTRLETLQAEATRLHRIVEDFLRLVGRPELRLAPRDLNDLVRELVGFYEPLAQVNGVRIHVVPADRPLLCRIDADLFKQAMLNICLNAQDAMPQGGDLTIRTRIADDGAGHCIDFADTGPGLSPENAERIFQPYYSTKPGGTGLGLALTRRIIHAHGGRIAASSRPDQGTTFTITLPAAEES